MVFTGRRWQNLTNISEYRHLQSYFMDSSNPSHRRVLPQLQVHRVVIVVDNVAFDDDVTDDLLMSSQLVNKVLPSAVKHGGQRVCCM